MAVLQTIVRYARGALTLGAAEVTTASGLLLFEGGLVALTELSHPALARHDPRVVRWELFVFPDVRDVLATSRPDTVVVAHRGRARPDEWLAALATAGMLDEQPAPDAAA